MLTRWGGEVGGGSIVGGDDVGCGDSMYHSVG